MSNFWYKGMSSVSLVSAILAVGPPRVLWPCVHLLSMQQRPHPQRLRIGSVAASPDFQATFSQSSPIQTNQTLLKVPPDGGFFFVESLIFGFKNGKVSGPQKTLQKTTIFFGVFLPLPGWSFQRFVRQSMPWRGWTAAGNKCASAFWKNHNIAMKHPNYHPKA